MLYASQSHNIHTTILYSNLSTSDDLSAESVNVETDSSKSRSRDKDKDKDKDKKGVSTVAWMSTYGQEGQLRCLVFGVASHLGQSNLDSLVSRPECACYSAYLLYLYTPLSVYDIIY